MQTHRKGPHQVDHEEALSAIRDSRFLRGGGNTNTLRRPMYEPMRPAPSTPRDRETRRASHALSIGEYPAIESATASTAASATPALGTGKQAAPEVGAGLPRPILKKPSASALETGPSHPNRPGPGASRPPGRRRIGFGSPDAEPPAYGDLGSSQSAVASDASGVPVWSPSQETCTHIARYNTIYIQYIRVSTIH